MLREPLLHKDRGQRAKAPGIGAGADREVVVGHRRSLVAARVDHDHGAGRIGGDFAQHQPRTREAVRLSGVLADQQRDLGVREIVLHPAAEHPCLHPGLAGLFLRQRIGAVAHAERRQRALRVDSGQVVPPRTAAIVEDALAPVRIAHRSKLRGDLADRHVP